MIRKFLQFIEKIPEYWITVNKIYIAHHVPVVIETVSVLIGKYRAVDQV